MPQVQSQASGYPVYSPGGGVKAVPGVSQTLGAKVGQSLFLEFRGARHSGVGAVEA
jgi:hypothetical protein